MISLTCARLGLSVPPSHVPVAMIVLISLLVIASWILKPSNVTWHHSDAPVYVKRRCGKQWSLPEICKTLAPRCFLTPLLPNGHLQTLWTCLEPQSDPVHYLRRYFVQQDQKASGVFAVDFVTEFLGSDDGEIAPRTKSCTDQQFQHLPSNDSAPMVIALHGLCGGSHELYLRHVLAPLLSGNEKWHACVLISRGCAGTPIEGSGIYNAALTCDLRQTVRWLRQAFPNRPLFAVGFSMGASILTRYVAEEGRACAFKGVVVVSNPWNLEVCALHLQRSILGRLIYSPVMASNLMGIFWRNAAKIVSRCNIDLHKAKQVKYIHEFDRYIQCPTWGFRTETEYYRRASSSSSVLDVKVPFLAINATDDPITGSEAIPTPEFQQSGWAVLCTTTKGGHLGWFEFNGKRWYASVAVNFLREMHSLLGRDPTSDSLGRINIVTES